MRRPSPQRQFTIELTDEQAKRLTYICKVDGVTPNVVITKAVELGLAMPIGLTIPYDRGDAFNFNKEQYEELFATERQLGTTRARIVWTPATIAVGVLALFLKGQGDALSLKAYFISITIMYVVLILSMGC